MIASVASTLVIGSIFLMMDSGPGLFAVKKWQKAGRSVLLIVPTPVLHTRKPCGL